jgi:hypothetical protein
MKIQKCAFPLSSFCAKILSPKNYKPNYCHKKFVVQPSKGHGHLGQHSKNVRASLLDKCLSTTVALIGTGSYTNVVKRLFAVIDFFISDISGVSSNI